MPITVLLHHMQICGENMRNINYTLLAIAGFLSVTMMAAGPIVFNNATLIKQLNHNVDNPVFLFKSTDPQHNNKAFTARVIARLDADGLPLLEQSSVRDEICANSKIQAANAASAFSATPGAFGFYLYHDAIVAIYDKALLGKPLSSVLNELKNVDDTHKRLIANDYVAQLRDLLGQIHNAGILWNNEFLSNIYVRPDGTLTGVDFSMATMDPAGNAVDSTAKQKERKNFMLKIVKPMYRRLFRPAGNPATGDADRAFQNINNIQGVANWRTTPANFTNAVFSMLGNPSPALRYLPGVDAAVGDIANITRAEHASTQANNGAAAFLGANGFALDDAVRQLVLNTFVTPIVAFSRLDGALVGADASSLCLGWTGVINR